MSRQKPKLLIVDDETDAVYSFRRIFEKSDYVLIEANSGEQALHIFKDQRPDVVLMDLRMPGLDGISALKEIRKIEARTPVILMTAFASTQSTIEAMKAGAYDYVLKPFEIEKIRTVIASAVKVSQDMRQVVSYQPLLDDEAYAEEIVGTSAAMQAVYKLIGRVSASDEPVLITGESGTGKELVARAIYHHSDRSAKPFVAVNCAAMTEELLDMELFGQNRAVQGQSVQGGKPGKIELCEGGTIFLDEIAEVPLPIQGKLLRLLETGEVEPHGGGRVMKANVRILASTSRDLRECIELGAFRPELYYRLQSVEIPLPPLRERLEDLPLLVASLVRRHSSDASAGAVSVHPSVLDLLTRRTFPGNVRELDNIIKNSLLRLTGNVLRADDLHFAAGEGGGLAPEQILQLADDSVFDMLFDEIARRQPLPEGFDAFDIVERRLIVRALAECSGNQSRAAKFLGITRNTLRKRVKKYGVKIERNVRDSDDEND